MFWSDRDPEGRAFAPLADACRRAGDVRQAFELLSDGLSRHPDFASGHVVAARLYLSTGMNAEAELAAQRALALDPENVDALASLADALEARGAEEAAAEARSKLGELDAAGDEAAEAPAPDTDAEAEAEAAAAEASAVDLSGLGGEDAGEPVMELDALAPDEAEADAPAGDIAALAPDEPVMELEALAPDEPVMELDALAPHEAEADEPAADIAALAPDEPVMELEALAPDEPVMELDALAPDEAEADAPADADDTEEAPLATRTLADLYARQGLLEQSLAVYRQLQTRAPGDEELGIRIAELERQRDEPARGGAPASIRSDDLDGSPWDADDPDEDVDTPFAWADAGDPDDEDGAPIGEYFARMLGWPDRGTAAEPSDASADESAPEDGAAPAEAGAGAPVAGAAAEDREAPSARPAPDRRPDDGADVFDAWDNP